MVDKTFYSFSDEELVKMSLLGHDVCLSLLYKRFFNKVYNKCFNFTKDRNDAFDYAQEILIKALGKLSTFKGTSSFSTWIYAITRNYCIENFRKKNYILFESLPDKYIISDYSENHFSEQLEVAEQNLIKVLQKISESDRIILELKYSQNYSIKELQNSYQLSASAIKMRLQRARQKIEKIYVHYNLSAIA